MIEDNPDYAPDRIECAHCGNDSFFLFRGNFGEGKIRDELNCTQCGGRRFFYPNPEVDE